MHFTLLYRNAAIEMVDINGVTQSYRDQCGLTLLVDIVTQ